MRLITDLRDRHPGADVFVLAAGPSLNFLDPRFFDGRVVVAVNSASRVWGATPTYVVCKEHAEEAAILVRHYPTTPVVVSRRSAGASYGGDPPNAPNVYVFNHLPNKVQDFVAARDWPTDPDSLVVSWSTITSAMHFAAYLGAANIFVVGHDCGELDGQRYVRGYEPQATADWLVQIEAQSREVKQELIRRYGVRVYSLSPFLNANLDGVRYIGENRINA